MEEARGVAWQPRCLPCRPPPSPPSPPSKTSPALMHTYSAEQEVRSQKSSSDGRLVWLVDGAKGGSQAGNGVASRGSGGGLRAGSFFTTFKFPFKSILLSIRSDSHAKRTPLLSHIIMQLPEHTIRLLTRSAILPLTVAS